MIQAIKIPKQTIFVLLLSFFISLPIQSIEGQQRTGAARNAQAIPNRNNSSASRPQATPNRNSSTVNKNKSTSRRNSVSANKRKGLSSNKGAGNRPNINSGNNTVNINVDRSKDIRINNSRNTTVRHNNNRPYNRPPYHYGGRHYSCYHPYRYHPYTPYSWGPMWHPWGYFIRTVATTAIIISIANQQYHYNQGVYYMAGNGGYTVVQAPIGAVITTLPKDSQTVVVNETTNNYYYGGTFYEKSENGYTVVAPTAGTTVEYVSTGGEEVVLGNQTYVKIGDTYYQPVEIDGKKLYEVSLVEDDI